MASLMSVNNNSDDIAPLEDVEDEDYSQNDSLMKSSLLVSHVMQQMTNSWSDSDIASTPMSSQYILYTCCHNMMTSFLQLKVSSHCRGTTKRRWWKLLLPLPLRRNYCLLRSRGISQSSNGIFIRKSARNCWTDWASWRRRTRRSLNLHHHRKS